MAIMKPAQRRKWLLRHITNSPTGTNILDADMVEQYIEATGVVWDFMMWGAHKCRALSADLTKLYQDGYLSRATISIPEASSGGFPKWVYTYELSPKARTMANQGVGFWMRDN